MLGQVVYQRDGKGTKVVRAPLHGVPVLRAALDPEGFWARRRAGRAARRLVRQGAARVLVPEDFPFWEELSRAGLRPVDPLPLLRSCAAPMALALLRRQGEDPLRAAVALRGSRAERDLVRAAEELCPRVRDLCLSVQTGGGELERYLHRQYGVALRPDWAGVQAAIRFDPRAQAPWFRYVDGQGREHEVWFEDARSIRAKLALAAELCKKPAYALAQAKYAIVTGQNFGVGCGKLFERQLFALTFSNSDQVEGMHAFLERREPRFQNQR